MSAKAQEQQVQAETGSGQTAEETAACGSELMAHLQLVLAGRRW